MTLRKWLANRRKVLKAIAHGNARRNVSDSVISGRLFELEEVRLALLAREFSTARPVAKEWRELLAAVCSETDKGYSDRIYNATAACERLLDRKKKGTP
ncbi:MAG: hypothetical protein KGJ13_10390 [Patescibacteria group bacterium]|nr:hypothetical protein [Patescibacteria group bacterium]